MSFLRSRKFWIIVLVVLIGFELIWVVGANWALSSEWVTAKINSKPEKLEVNWQEASTIFPGIINLEGLSVRGQSRKQQWYVELSDGRAHISLLSFALKTFRTHSFSGSGLDFRLRKRVLPGDEPPRSAAFAPEIPGLAVDEPPFPPKSKKKKKRPWTIALGNIHIDGIEQLAIMAMKLTAEGSIDATMSIELSGGPMSMKRVKMNLTKAEFLTMGEPALQEAQLTMDARMESFVPKEAKGLEILRSLTGTIGLSGTAKGAAMINTLLAKIDSVELGSPGGQLDGVIEIESGLLAPGTTFGFRSDQGWVDIMDWRATGLFEIQSRVEQQEGDVVSSVHVGLTEVALTGIDTEEPLLAGANLTLDTEAGSLDVAGGVEGLSSSLESIDFDLSNAHVADITRFPIPAFEDFSLDAGEVLVETHAVLTRDNGGEAGIKVTGKGIDASYGEVALKGNLLLDIQAQSEDVSDRRFDFSDSSLKIDMDHIDHGKKTEEGWYFHVRMPEGWMRLKEPGEIVARAEISMKDTRPLIAILGQEKKILNRLKGLLNFKDLEGEADLEIAANRLEIENFDIDSEGLKLKANLQIKDKKSSGILYTKFHGIPFAVDMRGEKNDLKLSKPLKWYEEQTVPWAGQPQPEPANR